MRIFKTKWLVRCARRQRIDDASLKEAIEHAGRGPIDADLGGWNYQATGRAHRPRPLWRPPHAGRLSGEQPHIAQAIERGILQEVVNDDQGT